MKEHPILFSGEMIRAIWDGRKTQTRRVIRFRDVPDDPTCHSLWIATELNGPKRGLKQWQDGDDVIHCPYGWPGDRLWVRETWRPADCPGGVLHKADCTEFGLQISTRENSKPWKPSIHMPRWASRITLEITGVRAERVQKISLDDSEAEGMGFVRTGNVAVDTDAARQFFKVTWNTINKKRGFGWGSNPWVWVIEFKRVQDI